KGDLFAGSEVMATTGLAYYSGDDALNLAWLAHGAAGIVSVVGHVASASYRRMIDAIVEGDLAAARQIHTALIPVVQTVMSPASQGAIQAKAGVQLLGVIPERTVRLPLLPASDAEVDRLDQVLRKAGLSA